MLLLLWRSLGTYHGLNFFKTHHLSGGRRNLLLLLILLLLLLLLVLLLLLLLVLLLRFLVRCVSRLLRLQPPDVCACLQLRDVFRVVVTLIAGPGRLGRMGNRGLLLLGRGLASLIEHLLLLYGARDLGRLPSKIEVFADVLLRRRAGAEGVIVEDIVGFIELVT